MQERLPDDRDELSAGKIGAGIFLSDAQKRHDLLKLVPEHLRERVKGIVFYFDNRESQNQAKEIAALKTKKERNEALRKIPLHIRITVKEMVIKIFDERKK